jgi:hypothetical protein
MSQKYFQTTEGGCLEYVFGDWTAENTAMRLAGGLDTLEFGQARAENGRLIFGETTRDGKGRLITLADVGNVNDKSGFKLANSI